MTSKMNSQYRLEVGIGMLVFAEMEAGMTHDEAISVIRKTLDIAERNKAFGINFAKDRA